MAQLRQPLLISGWMLPEHPSGVIVEIQPDIRDKSSPKGNKMMTIHSLKFHALTFAILAGFGFSMISGIAQAQQAPARSVTDIFNEGIALYNQDRFDDALKRFEFVRTKSPRDPRNMRYLKLTELAIKEGRGPKVNLEGTLSKIVIPEIDFKDANLGDVMSYLSQRVEELSGGKTTANFIYKGTPEQRDNTFVTLKLRNTPLTEVIRYVGSLSDTGFRYDEHAIVATPAVAQTVSAPQGDLNTANPLPTTPAAPNPFD